LSLRVESAQKLWKHLYRENLKPWKFASNMVNGLREGILNITKDPPIFIDRKAKIIDEL